MMWNGVDSAPPTSIARDDDRNQSHGVGQATSVKIVFRTETRVVEQKILDGLEPAYREQANPTNESVREAVDALPFRGGSEHGPTE